MNENKSKNVRKILMIQIVLNLVLIGIVLGVFYLLTRTRTYPDGELVFIMLFILIAMILSMSVSIYINHRTQVKLDEDRLSRSIIVARASRDMRTPMNTIINASNQDMVSRYNPQDMKNALDNVNSAGKYLMTLIEDLLALSKLKDRQLTLDEKPHTIMECVEESFHMVMPHFEKKNIHFNIEYKNVDVCRYVNVDSVRVQQVLVNLLNNACKYTPSEGHVDLVIEGLNQTDEYVDIQFTLSDDGIGIPQGALKNLLKIMPDDIAAEKGMGMTIVNALVKAMNGKITCESQEDKGTTFVINFRWPYCYKDQVEKITTDYSVLNGKHILLVENNAMSAEVAKQILETQGMSMDLAVNGKDGVEIFTHAMPHTYDAILMDIRMPLMDGIEATQIIRQSTHPESDIIPIIAMTADAFDEDRQRTRDAGMNAHITKPINPQELFTTLTNYLR